MRYVILARLLGPEQLGLAATLLLTAQFFESLSDTGANRFIVQDARGDQDTHWLARGELSDPRVIATSRQTGASVRTRSRSLEVVP